MSACGCLAPPCNPLQALLGASQTGRKAVAPKIQGPLYATVSEHPHVEINPVQITPGDCNICQGKAQVKTTLKAQCSGCTERLTCTSGIQSFGKAGRFLGFEQ